MSRSASDSLFRDLAVRPQAIAAQDDGEEPRRHLERKWLSGSAFRHCRRSEDTGADDTPLLGPTWAGRVLRSRRPVAGLDIRVSLAFAVQRHRGPGAQP